MKKGILFFLFCVGAAGVLILGVGQERGGTYNAVLSTSQVEKNALIPASLVVGADRYEIQVPPGSTVYDAMKQAVEQGFEFKGRNFFGIGFFVEEINGKSQSNRERMYWIYSINAKKAEGGVSSYIIQPNDVISWSYEESY